MLRQPANPDLIFTWGNPSRGDDALGPALYELLQQENLSGVDVLTDFQLQIEHSIDLEGRKRVLFVDASTSAEAPFELSRVQPEQDASYTGLAAVYPRLRLRPWTAAVASSEQSPAGSVQPYKGPA